uniref:DUF148 domain-containing protein n=1 Tax=Rhabditophanes sp. KR3021 TaxID=114890 RepID=A0AC35TFZ1_9BILA
MQSKNIILVLALAGSLLAFPQDQSRHEGGGSKEMGGFKGGREGGGHFPFFLQNATQATKTLFEENQRNHTLSRNARTAGEDAVIATDSGEGVQSGYATFKAEMTAKMTALKAMIDANITASSLTADQKTLIQSFEAIYGNGDLTPQQIRNQTEALEQSTNEADLKAIGEFFKSLRIHEEDDFDGKFGRFEGMGQNNGGPERKGGMNGDQEGNGGMNGRKEEGRENERAKYETTPAP